MSEPRASSVVLVLLFLVLSAQSADGVPGGDLYGTRILTVAEEGGDFHSIQAALDSITDAGEEKRYLVYVAPGIYRERVTMKPYVDIEGAGELATLITSGGGRDCSWGFPRRATVNGALGSELRSLTVEQAGGLCAKAFHLPSVRHPYPPGASSLRIIRVTLEARDAEFASVGLSDFCPCCSGAASGDGDATDSVARAYLDQVKIEVEAAPQGYGVGVSSTNCHFDLRLDRVDISVIGGERATGLSLTHGGKPPWRAGDHWMRQGTIRASGSTVLSVGAFVSEGALELSQVTVDAEHVGVIANSGPWRPPLRMLQSSVRGGELSLSGAYAEMIHSQLIGPVDGEPTLRCFATCDRELAELDELCQPGG